MLERVLESVAWLGLAILGVFGLGAILALCSWRFRQRLYK